jgi:2-methylcitrate dehydratase PrpD
VVAAARLALLDTLDAMLVASAPRYPARYSSEVEVRTRDGRLLSRRVESARGTPANPMTPDEIRTKYRRLAIDVVPARGRRRSWPPSTAWSGPAT